MRHIIAIGGGGFGRNPGEGLIEQYILDQTGKEQPNICFIPTATGDNEAYKVNYYSTFSKLHCNPVHLDFFKRTPDLKKLIIEQDAIFVGGGNTKSMLAVWKVTYWSALNRGVSFCSAAACIICCMLCCPWRARMAASCSNCCTVALHIKSMSTFHFGALSCHI